jgi:hypothetical protein
VCEGVAEVGVGHRRDVGKDVAGPRAGGGGGAQGAAADRVVVIFLSRLSDNETSRGGK